MFLLPQCIILCFTFLYPCVLLSSNILLLPLLLLLYESVSLYLDVMKVLLCLCAADSRSTDVALFLRWSYRATNGACKELFLNRLGMLQYLTASTCCCQHEQQHFMKDVVAAKCVE